MQEGLFLLLEKGYCLSEAGKYPEAELLFREYLEFNPISAKVWYDLGIVLEFQNFWSKAVKAYLEAAHLFRKTLDADPLSADALISLGLVLKRLGDEKEALDIIDQGICMQLDIFDR
ncbi:MAG: tetratricopeptide repeat protein [Candidatus Thorarchaeota archaeon]